MSFNIDAIPSLTNISNFHLKLTYYIPNTNNTCTASNQHPSSHDIYFASMIVHFSLQSLYSSTNIIMNQLHQCRMPTRDITIILLPRNNNSFMVLLLPSLLLSSTSFYLMIGRTQTIATHPYIANQLYTNTNDNSIFHFPTHHFTYSSSNHSAPQNRTVRLWLEQFFLPRGVVFRPHKTQIYQYG